MTTLAQINDTQVLIVSFRCIPVVTTEMLANFYKTENVRIQQNHTRNKERFIEGKHFFKIVGQELKNFVTSLKIVANPPKISNKVRSLILWTERGAARHAKMLDTDQAWDVFEQLEDCYFIRKEILAKTHKSERTSLHEAHALLVAKTKHLSSSDAWKLIHQRFNVDHIEEIPYDMIPVVVEYVHHLIALMSNKNGNTGLDTNVRAMAIYLAWLSGWWRQFGPAVRGINPHMAAAIHDYFNDGGFVAWSFIEKDKRAELHKRIDTHPWHLPPMDRYHLLNRN
ncbi:ORF6N domain-containing protein [Acinetobacter geminorum]